MLHLFLTVFCILLPPTSVLWPLVVDGSHLLSWLPLTQSSLSLCFPQELFQYFFRFYFLSSIRLLSELILVKIEGFWVRFPPALEHGSLLFQSRTSAAIFIASCHPLFFITDDTSCPSLMDGCTLWKADVIDGMLFIPFEVFPMPMCLICCLLLASSILIMHTSCSSAAFFIIFMGISAHRSTPEG